MKGTAADRVQEFPAEDVQLHRDVLPEADGTYRVPVKGELRLHRPAVGREPAVAASGLGIRRRGRDSRRRENDPVADLVRRIGLAGKLGARASVARASRESPGLELQPRVLLRGTQKVRWVFSRTARTPVIVKGLHAYSRSRWITLDLRIESTRPAGRAARSTSRCTTACLSTRQSPAEIPIGGPGTWPKPLSLKVRAAVTKRYKADRTVLQFQFPELAFGVAVEDLVANDCVYVPHAGVFVIREPAPVTREEYLQKIAGKKTLLAQVREKPDQTFAQAMAMVHNPIQDLGPMMISLACDSRKFVAEREGRCCSIRTPSSTIPERPIPMQWQLAPRFGSGKDQQISRELTGGWLPMPTTTVVEGDIAYRQCTYVAPVDDSAPAGSPVWVRDRAVGVVEYSVKNQGNAGLQGRVA